MGSAVGVSIVSGVGAISTTGVSTAAVDGMAVGIGLSSEVSADEVGVSVGGTSVGSGVAVSATIASAS